MYRKKSLGNFVLLCLEKTVDGYCRFEDFTYHHYRYKYGIPKIKQSELSRALKRLRERGLIDFVDDDKLIVRLTDQGKEKALLSKIFVDDNKWDRKWRIVVFDIPEKRRAVRDMLRSKLKAWDFIYLQKSVWASKKNCTEELRGFIKHVGIKDWVMTFESDNVDF